MSNVIDLNTIDRLEWLPTYLEIRYSKIKGAGLGVFAKEDICANTCLGNYVGQICQGVSDAYTFTTRRHGHTVKISALDTRSSNSCETAPAAPLSESYGRSCWRRTGPVVTFHACITFNERLVIHAGQPLLSDAVV